MCQLYEVARQTSQLYEVARQTSQLHLTTLHENSLEEKSRKFAFAFALRFPQHSTALNGYYNIIIHLRSSPPISPGVEGPHSQRSQQQLLCRLQCRPGILRREQLRSDDHRDGEIRPQLVVGVALGRAHAVLVHSGAMEVAGLRALLLTGQVSVQRDPEMVLEAFFDE